MSLYGVLETPDGLRAPSDLSSRLAAWHDAMVAHERGRRTGSGVIACDDECPHAEARELWSEAVATLGDRAHALTFLRASARSTVRS